MNKKFNLSLNIIESVLVMVLITISSVIYLNNFTTNLLNRSLITSGMLLLSALIISIELLLLYLETNKFRLITLLYYFACIILMFLSNSIVPFFGISIVMFLNIAKNVLRVNKREMIYDKETLYELCDWFNIKIKKEKKKRVAVKKTVKTTNKTKAVKTTTTKTKRTPARKEAEKSFA